MMVGGYELTKYLNGDGLGKDYLANKLNSLFIIKRIDRDITESNINLFNSLKNAVLILREINHKNIAKFVQVMKTKRHYYIVIEYSNGGKLKENMTRYKIKYGKSFSEKKFQHIFKQLVDVNSFLHDNNVGKFDISLDNIYLNYHTEEAKKNLDILHSDLKLYLWKKKLENEEPCYIFSCHPFLRREPLLINLIQESEKNPPEVIIDLIDVIWWSSGLFNHILFNEVFNFIEIFRREIEEYNFKISTNFSSETIFLLINIFHCIFMEKKEPNIKKISEHPFLAKYFGDFTDFNKSNFSNYIKDEYLIFNINNIEEINSIFNNKFNSEINL